LSELKFEWDPAKAAFSWGKHGVSFKEAQTVFDDPQLKREYDVKHAVVEDRWLVIGFSQRLRLISVAFTKRHETIRIISARRATKAESGRYAQSL
jgi:hypothetical protein